MELLHKSNLITLLLVLAVTCEHGVSHVIVFRNKYNRVKNLLKVECYGGATIVGQGPHTFVNLGEKITITVPRLARPVYWFRFGPEPSSMLGCTGQFNDGFKDLFKFNLYSPCRDDERCKNQCTIEARDSGVYGKNSTENKWYYLTPYPVLP